MKDCIRIAEIKEYTGLSASSIWRLEYKGSFPKRRQLGKRAVGWLRCEVEEWLQSCQAIEVGSGAKDREAKLHQQVQLLDQEINLPLAYFLISLLSIADLIQPRN